jgi:hypothetical protein
MGVGLEFMFKEVWRELEVCDVTREVRLEKPSLLDLRVG